MPRRILSSPWLAGLIVAALAGLWLATARFDLIDRLQFIGAVPMRPVSSGHEMVQTFVAEDDNLSRVDLQLYRPKVDAPGRLRVEIVEVREEGRRVELGRSLGEASYDTSKLDFTIFRRFGFAPVALVPGERYGIRLTSDDPDDEAASPGAGPAIGYVPGLLFIDGEATEADLYFVLYHEGDAAELLARNRPWRPSLLGSAEFFVAVLLTGAAAFGWLLKVLSASGEPEGGGQPEAGGKPEGEA